MNRTLGRCLGITDYVMLLSIRRCYGRLETIRVSKFCLHHPLSQPLHHEPLYHPQISSGYKFVPVFRPPYLPYSLTHCLMTACLPEALNMQNRPRMPGNASSSLKLCWGARPFVQTVKERRLGVGRHPPN